MKDLTVIYYTSNWLDTHNPYFLENTKKQLLRAIGDLPLISVSQKPIVFGQNICVGETGRSHLNLYRQILEGVKPGEEVVTSAQFLIDSESKLREAVDKMRQKTEDKAQKTEIQKMPQYQDNQVTTPEHKH